MGCIGDIGAMQVAGHEGMGGTGAMGGHQVPEGYRGYRDPSCYGGHWGSADHRGSRLRGVYHVPIGMLRG